MSIRFLIASLAAAGMLAACGGGDSPPSAATGPARLAATASSSAGASASLSFPGIRAAYSIQYTGDGYAVTNQATGASTTVPRGARLRFADISLALDVDGVAGRAYRLYRAAFDRVPDIAGLSFWIGAMDRGVAPDAVASAFMESAEFKAMYGGDIGDADFVAKLYFNVLHRAGDPSGIAFWSNVLAKGTATRAQVLAAFGESTEGKSVVSGAIRNGIYYLEDGVAYLPAADAGTNRVVDLGATVVMDGSTSTVTAGKPIVYYWSLGKKPAGSAAVLSGANSVHPSFVPDVEGEYQVKLVVSDGTDYSREVGASVAAVWRPDESQLPASGNLVYLESENGDPVGKGQSYTFTQANAIVSVTPDGRRINFSISGDTDWSGSIAVPSRFAKLVPGYYGQLGTDAWSDKGGVYLSGPGYCYNNNSSNVSNWFVVDSASYDGDRLVGLELRFGAHCPNSFGTLRGRIRWTPDDATRPPGPIDPPPADLWQPAAGTTPASGNYIYLESTTGDPVGNGQKYLYSGDAPGFTIGTNGSSIDVRVTGGSYWYGNFTGINSLSRITAGYYGNVQRYPSNNPTRPGMSWTNWQSCDSITGWYVVDKVTYSGGALAELDLRFEQHCNGRTAPLNGKVHWRSPSMATAGPSALAKRPGA